MKVSSISGTSIGPSLPSNHEATSLLQVAQRVVNAMYTTLDRIGTSIALGESGNLEASHEFRQKNSGQ